MKRPIVLLLLMALMFSGCGQKSSDALSWQEQYDLGVRYLSEGNYEEAIIAFTAAIEIDPHKSETYLDLFNAYMSIGDAEGAFDILSKAELNLSSDALASLTVDVSNAEYRFDLHGENILSYEDLPEAFRLPFDKMDSIWDVSPWYYHEDESFYFSGDDRYRYAFQMWSYELDNGFGPDILSAMAPVDDNTLLSLTLNGNAMLEAQMPLYWRGIRFSDSFEQILGKLGLSSELMLFSDIQVSVSNNVAPTFVKARNWNPEYPSIQVDFYDATADQRYSVSFDFADGASLIRVRFHNNTLLQKISTLEK